VPIYAQCKRCLGMSPLPQLKSTRISTNGFYTMLSCLSIQEINT